MLQEGVPRRVLFLEAQKALNCFSCSPEPKSLVCPLFIAFPYPRLAPPSSTRGPEELLVLISPVVQKCAGSVASWTHRVLGPSASLSPFLGGPQQWHNFSSFTSKSNPHEKKANKKTLALQLDRGSRQLSLLRPSFPRLPPSALLSGRDGCFSSLGGGCRRDLLWRRQASRCTGWLPWNGSFLLALVLALGHAKVVRARISWKKPLFIEKEICFWTRLTFEKSIRELAFWLAKRYKFQY